MLQCTLLLVDLDNLALHLHLGVQTQSTLVYAMSIMCCTEYGCHSAGFIQKHDVTEKMMQMPTAYVIHQI